MYAKVISPVHDYVKYSEFFRSQLAGSSLPDICC